MKSVRRNRFVFGVPSKSWSIATLACVVSTAAARAQESQPIRIAPSAPRVDHSRVYYDMPGDGALWARGATYKARFDAAGATYIPLLGPDVPSAPVLFRLEDVTFGDVQLAFEREASPARTDDRVVFDRGVLTELYDLTPGSIEQQFVFDNLPTRGDLVLRIAIESDLAPRGSAEGLEFANERGSVRYGRAVAIDARGARTTLETSLRGSAIEIRVPASALASARFPLTIDPVVSTFVVDSSSVDQTLPDVAYTAGSDRYLVTFEEAVSSTDHDVFCQLLSSSGTPVLGGYADMTTAYWAHPKDASNRSADQFLVVAQVGLPASGTRIIRGRTVGAAALAMSSAFTINGSETGDKFNPDVGGDPNNTSPTYYCVVWERTSSSTDHDIHGRLVRTNGTLLGASTVFINNTAALDTRPSISKSDGAAPSATQEWNIVWQREITPTNHDLYAAQIHWNGTITASSFLIDNSTTNDDVDPVVSSLLDGATGSRDYLIVCQSGPSPTYYAGFLYNGTARQDLKDLSALENILALGSFYLPHFRPSTDSDGTVFAVACTEAAPDFNVYMATFSLVGGNLWASEVHLALGATADVEDHVQVVSTHSGGGGGGSRRFASVWDRATGGSLQGEIEANLYDSGQFTGFCHSRPGFADAIPCPCNNPPSDALRGCNNSANTGGALLLASGLASVSADTVVLTASGEKPTALSVFLGSIVPFPAGAVYGQGVRCLGGHLRRLYVHAAVGGVVVAPSGGDLSITARSAALGEPISAGSHRYYQTYYRDPTVLGGCPGTSTFNVTQAVQVIWYL